MTSICAAWPPCARSIDLGRALRGFGRCAPPGRRGRSSRSRRSPARSGAGCPTWRSKSSGLTATLTPARARPPCSGPGAWKPSARLWARASAPPAEPGEAAGQREAPSPSRVRPPGREPAAPASRFGAAVQLRAPVGELDLPGVKPVRWPWARCASLRARESASTRRSASRTSAARPGRSPPAASVRPQLAGRARGRSAQLRQQVAAVRRATESDAELRFALAFGEPARSRRRGARVASTAFAAARGGAVEARRRSARPLLRRARAAGRAGRRRRRRRRARCAAGRPRRRRAPSFAPRRLSFAGPASPSPASSSLPLLRSGATCARPARGRSPPARRVGGDQPLEAGERRKVPGSVIGPLRWRRRGRRGRPSRRRSRGDRSPRRGAPGRRWAAGRRSAARS